MSDMRKLINLVESYQDDLRYNDVDDPVIDDVDEYDYDIPDSEHYYNEMLRYKDDIVRTLIDEMDEDVDGFDPLYVYNHIATEYIDELDHYFQKYVDLYKLSNLSEDEQKNFFYLLVNYPLKVGDISSPSKAKETLQEKNVRRVVYLMAKKFGVLHGGGVLGPTTFNDEKD